MENRPGGEMLAAFVRDFTDHAIVIIDLEGRILSWNAGAKEILGYDPAEIVGRYLVELEKRDALPGSVYVPLSDTLEGGRRERTAQLVHKQGAVMKVRVVSSPVRDRDNRLAGHGLFLSSLGSTGMTVISADRPAPTVVVPPAKPKVTGG